MLHTHETPINTGFLCNKTRNIVTKKGYFVTKIMKVMNDKEKMNNTINVLKGVCAEVWRNYKHHAEEYDSSNPSAFWDSWVSDLDEMGAGYESDPISDELFKRLAKGLFEATKEGLKYEWSKS